MEKDIEHDMDSGIASGFRVQVDGGFKIEGSILRTKF